MRSGHLSALSTPNLVDELTRVNLKGRGLTGSRWTRTRAHRHQIAAWPRTCTRADARPRRRNAMTDFPFPATSASSTRGGGIRPAGSGSVRPRRIDTTGSSTPDDLLVSTSGGSTSSWRPAGRAPAPVQKWPRRGFFIAPLPPQHVTEIAYFTTAEEFPEIGGPRRRRSSSRLANPQRRSPIRATIAGGPSPGRKPRSLGRSSRRARRDQTSR